eukprot:UC4_evm3s1127
MAQNIEHLVSLPTEPTDIFAVSNTPASFSDDPVSELRRESSDFSRLDTSSSSITESLSPPIDQPPLCDSLNIAAKSDEDRSNSLCRKNAVRKPISNTKRIQQIFTEIITRVKMLNECESLLNNKVVNFQFLLALLQVLEHKAIMIAEIAGKYDCHPTIKGNGYHSILAVITALCERLNVELDFIQLQPKKKIFSWLRGGLDYDNNASEKDSKEFLLHRSCIDELIQVLQQLTTLVSHTPMHEASGTARSLFDFPSFKAEQLIELLEESNVVNMAVFFGSQFGFMFSNKLRKLLMKIVTVACGVFDANILETERVKKRNDLSSSWKAVPMVDPHDAATNVTTLQIASAIAKYSRRPKMRGDTFTAGLKLRCINSFKALWNLPDTLPLARFAGLATSGSIAVNTLLDIPVPDELCLEEVKLGATKFRDGKGHIIFQSVKARLLSYYKRMGQVHASGLEFKGQEKGMPFSSKLLIHFHGGGFIAQSSRSHEPYLRRWARETEAPILSVDYTLAPEATHEQIVLECFFAYCWAISHADCLGSSAEKVVLAGDSAGGNICFAVCIKCIEENVRMPDGVLAAYPALYLQSKASPSRMLAAFDPVLPLQILTNLIDSISVSDEDSKKNPIVSPLLASDEFLLKLPKVWIGAAALDPLLDDAVEMCRRLESLRSKGGAGYIFRVFDRLCHGFLSFSSIGGGKDAQEASNVFSEWLETAFGEQEDAG